MLQARIRPNAGVNCWRRLLGSGSSGGGGGGSRGGEENLDLDLARRRALTLSLWRDYLCLLRRLSSPEDADRRRASAAAEIRGWGKGREKEAEEKKKGEETAPPLDPDAGVKRLMAAVSFLRATTSRQPGERKRLLKTGGGGGGGVFVVREGQLVRVDEGGDGEGASSSPSR